MTLHLSIGDWALVDPTVLTDIPGVLGTGVGVRVSDTLGEVFPLPVVKVFVGAKRPPGRVAAAEVIPRFAPVRISGLSGTATVMDIPTDVVELTEPASAGESEEEGFLGQACAGHKVSVDGLDPGTLGCIAMRRSTNERVLVSCYHVLVGPPAPFPAGPVGGTVYAVMNLTRPGGTVEPDVPVARVVTAACTDTPIRMDVAVAVITRPPSQAGPVRRLRRLPQHPEGFVGESELIVGKRVRKTGVGTRVTCGIVTAIAGPVTLESGQRLDGSLVIQNTETALCSRCPDKHSPTRISSKGDSGAVWITDEPVPRVAGIHWAGDGGRKAYATPWWAIEATSGLDVTILR